MKPSEAGPGLGKASRTWPLFQRRSCCNGLRHTPRPPTPSAVQYRSLTRVYVTGASRFAPSL
eukprot:15059-Prymnesium_polylepis.1